MTKFKTVLIKSLSDLDVGDILEYISEGEKAITLSMVQAKCGLLISLSGGVLETANDVIQQRAFNTGSGEWMTLVELHDLGYRKRIITTNL